MLRAAVPSCAVKHALSTSPAHTEVHLIKLALRRTFGAVLLSGAALALSTAAAMPAEAAATTVKVSSGPISGGNVLSVVGSSGP